MNELGLEVAFCRRVVKSWEKLRVLYIGVLLIPGLALLLRTLHLQQEIMAQNPPGMGYPIMEPVALFAGSFLFGIGANVCFCLGPYGEIMMAALGFSLTARRIRSVLFGLGLVLSLGVVMLVWFLVELP